MSRRKHPRALCPVCEREVTNLRSRFCSNACQAEQQHIDYIARWRAGHESGNVGIVSPQVSRHVRRHLLETRGEQCSSCGWAQRHPVTGLVPVTIDHKDGNWLNTVEENLRVLCPNCHSLTPTYGKLNLGNGRKHRRKAS